MRFAGLIVASLLHGALSSVLPRQEESLNATFPISVADSGSGIIVKAPSGLKLPDDGTTNGTGLGNLTLPSHNPDFLKLCLPYGQLPGNTPPFCLPGRDGYFQYSCVISGTVEQAHLASCTAPSFCMDVDGKNNVNRQANTVICTPVKGRGTLSINEEGTNTDRVCTTTGSRSNKLFGKVSDRTVQDNTVEVTYYVKHGNSAPEMIGQSITGSEDTYEISYNFKAGMHLCWWANIRKLESKGPGSVTVDWMFGLMEE